MLRAPRGARQDWMIMSLVLWLCTLVLVGLVVVPLFGPRAGAVAAVALLAGLLVACYFICVPRPSRGDATGGV